ncbi:hypothetical protein ICHIJ1_10170 [Fluviibacter phosphoraccumulans]|uniref:Uncharacterized protein n=1 Tax=Fluviibacter phosphoraccumulans TaxID=1751046 RepID=A0A7R6R5U4_9RHOO|nr:hypothetical protein ICHIAU1_20020 [Fluviibacter phosphoraccumulans]BBU71098.1 hypothetical protein ICHIJ1_10170 [Fluviibacter phosphoraccumulans]
MVFDAVKSANANNVINGFAYDFLNSFVEPLTVTAVRVSINSIAIEVGDECRNGIGNQPQLTLATPERFCNAKVFLMSLNQPAVNLFKEKCPLYYALFKFSILILYQSLEMTLFGDICVQSNETAIG